jgi:hypothetical protein
MVRDEQKRAKCSEAGKRGGGNPTFKGDNKGDPKGLIEIEKEIDSKKKKPSTDWNGDDLAHHLLREIGIVPFKELPVVVAQALELKAKQPGWTMEKAFIHMRDRALVAKGAKFRGKWVDWFAGGDYDKPVEAWQDKKQEQGARGYIPLKKAGQ